MRYAAIRPIDISDGVGIGVALFVQGCARHCKNCFNPETWDFNGGKEYTNADRDRILEYIKKPYIKRLSILGGEPLEEVNLTDVCRLVILAKREKPEIKIWIYTGYTYEELLKRIAYSTKDDLAVILDNIDYLVDGPFVEEEKDLSLKFAGSRNQRVIDMNLTKSFGGIPCCLTE